MIRLMMVIINYFSEYCFCASQHTVARTLRSRTENCFLVQLETRW